MILLLGSKDDTFTSYVSEWLAHYGQKYIVLLGEANVDILKYDKHTNNILINYYGDTINLLDIKSVLNRRRGFSTINFTKTNNLPKINIEIKNFPDSHLKIESIKAIEYIHYLIKKKCNNIIGGFNKNNVNKLIILYIAEKIGLNVPYYSILSTKKDLITFFNQAKNKNTHIITKPINEGIYSFSENYGYYSYVERIKESDIDKFPDSFFPSFFQLEIKKKYELRVFFLNNICYSMAILSQKNEYTKTDFRKPILNQKKNRQIPYKLPIDIEVKIQKLMNYIGLNTGSIDIIVDQNNNYYFLEVNPVGQILMTSIPCNYYLDKLVAKKLIE